jgi:16S rRNA (guanine527-N7)-methyltransferase
VAEPRLVAWLSEAGLQNALGRLEVLAVFEEMLYAANAKRNLTRVPRDEFWERHVVDSLLISEFAPEGASLLDVGTGPGFPAWPLAWARSDLRVTALDSNAKMLAFLASCPLDNLEIVNSRAEEWDVRERFDIVTGRAVAPLAVQVEISAAPCKVGGSVVPMRTPADERDVERFDVRPFGLSFERIERRQLPTSGAERLFPVYRKIAPTSSDYPRPWPKIVKRAR